MFFALMAMGVLSCTKEENLEQENSRLSNYQIIFSDPISYDNLSKKLSHAAVEKENSMVIHEMSDGNQIWRGFVPLRHSLTKQEFKNSIDKGVSGLKSEAGSVYRTVDESKSMNIGSYDYKIHELLIYSTDTKQASIEVAFPGAKIVAMSQGLNEGRRNQSEIKKKTTISDDDSWVPDVYAYNITNSVSYPGKRFLANAMIWTTDDPFGEWSNNVTFEPDFNLNNSSGSTLGPGTYLDKSEYINGVPDIYYAASSLPMAYLDTRDLDEDYIKTFTIGCPDASLINNNLIYLNYIVTEDGDADEDNAHVIFQRGQRVPSWVYNTWSVFNSDFVFSDLININGVDITIVDIDNEVPGYWPFTGSNDWPISVPGNGSWSKN